MACQRLATAPETCMPGSEAGGGSPALPKTMSVVPVCAAKKTISTSGMSWHRVGRYARMPDQIINPVSIDRIDVVFVAPINVEELVAAGGR